MPASKYWLFKTEPDTYSLERLEREGQTPWNGVRNFQARNFLKEARPGDLALIYHSGKDKAVVGTAKVIQAAYPDLDPRKPGDWVQIDIQFHGRLKSPVSLAQIKKDKTLAQMMLVRQGRLSCMPVTKREYERVLALGAL